jgi:hypothetical protein
MSALGFLWCLSVFAFGVLVSRNTDGENFGKLVGTVISGLAFIPPAIIFVRWYQRTEGGSTIDRPRGNEGIRSNAAIHQASSGGDTPIAATMEHD